MGQDTTTNSGLISLARQVALAHGLDDALICAVCEQESGWNSQATRYEPAFYEHYIVPMGLEEIEGRGRATSWGLMQVMGEVARELGFTGQFAELLEPQVGLDYGCKCFAQKLAKAQGDRYTALLQYNGGGNLNYAPQVINRMAKFINPATLDASDL